MEGRGLGFLTGVLAVHGSQSPAARAVQQAQGELERQQKQLEAGREIVAKMPSYVKKEVEEIVFDNKEAITYGYPAINKVYTSTTYLSNCSGGLLKIFVPEKIAYKIFLQFFKKLHSTEYSQKIEY